MPRVRSSVAAAVLAVAVWVLAVGPTAGFAQSSEPVVETDPSIPTVNQPVTIYFNADQGTGGLADFSGDVYAHTGVFTDQSPTEWTCVKNNWPTSDEFTGNRSDTQLTRVEPNRYKLEISDIRAFYNDNSTGCTLGADETIQTMNFVFRNADGSQEGKATGGDDIIVDLGDPNASIVAGIERPNASYTNPIVTDQNTTVSILAVAQPVGGGSVQSFTLSVNGTQQASVADDTLRYDLVLDAPGRKDVRIEATDDQGNTAVDSLYAVRAQATTEATVPAGIEDGITYTGSNSATLVLQAPKKSFVHVIGEMTDWEVKPEYQMKRETVTQDSVRYWIELDNLTPGTEYGMQYLVDGEIRIPDPYSEKVLSANDQFIPQVTYPNLKPYPSGKTDQLVTVLQTDQQPFNFTDFTRPEQKDLVIYELLVRDFIERHDYQTMQDTLAYLDRLGVNAIELMPVSEFDGNESWGYNPALYFATDKYYGPAEELKRFIDLAHQRGIAVILDVVYNQGTGQSPFVRLFNEGTYGAPTPENPWVNPSGRHPFNVFNDNNHESSFTKYWLDRANEYWLTEFNVDGFRFDLSKGFTQGPDPDGYTDVGAWSSYDQERIDILQRMADEIWSVDDRAYVILEHFAETSEEKVLAEYRTGEGLPGMMLWNNMNEAYRESAMGYADGSDLSNTYYRNRGITVPNYITYMESHDEQWLMYSSRENGNSSGDYDITELDTALERQKLVGAFFFTVPGPRMMWQFGELGYGYGDSGEQCLGDNCPSIAPGRTAPKPIRWDYRDPQQSPNRVKLYKTWSALINLRNAHEVFRSEDTNVTLNVRSNERVRRIQLEHPTMNVVVIGNFDVTARSAQTVFPAAGTWYDFFTGRELNIQSDELNEPVELAPGEFHVYTSQKVATPEAGIVPWRPAAPAPAAPTDLGSSVDLEAGTITLNWTASASSDVTGYQVYRSTTAGFDTTGAALASVDATTTSYTDDAVSSSEVYYYRVVAEDDDGVRSDATDELTALLYPENLSVEFTRTFGGGSARSDYRLVALPGEADQPLGNAFSGEAGDTWQAYWDNGSAEDYLVQFDGSSTFTFQPGRGFWVISEEDWTVQSDISTVNLTTGGTGQVAVIPLRPGWNIISNPFGINVPWSAVESANGGGLQPLWGFGGSFSPSDTFASATNGEAFYFNNQTDLARLQIPYTTTGSSSGQKAEGTRLALTAHRGAHASTVHLGTASDATDGVGPEDVIAPPRDFEAVSLRIDAQDAAAPRTSELVQSVRSNTADGHVYALTLHAAEDERVQLRPDGLGAWDAVRLVDRETGETHDLRTAGPIDVRLRADAHRFAVIAGSPDFVEKETARMAPDELRLWPNYPNPFSAQTTIQYTVPDDGTVRVEIYDILGRRVSVPVDGPKRAGLHRLQWDGRSRSGTTLASGVYLVRLTMNGTTRTRKMTILR